jgi:single-stranded DNA-binding protein
MRGINRVVLSGNVGDRVVYGTTRMGTQACSFSMASDRHDGDDVVTAWVRINLYGDDLVRICREKLTKGMYVIVEGELMNRDGTVGELTEVRAREVVFVTNNQKGNRRFEDGEHG